MGWARKHSCQYNKLLNSGNLELNSLSFSNWCRWPLTFILCSCFLLLLIRCWWVPAVLLHVSVAVCEQAWHLQLHLSWRIPAAGNTHVSRYTPITGSTESLFRSNPSHTRHTHSNITLQNTSPTSVIQTCNNWFIDTLYCSSCFTVLWFVLCLSSSLHWWCFHRRSQNRWQRR